MKLFVKRFHELTVDELYALLHVRSEVFVVEQDCVYQDLDFDDQKSIHVWLADDDAKILAMSRVCPAGTHMSQVSIGRVITTVRGRGYGLKIMRSSIQAAIDYFNADKIDIEAQEYAKAFYEKVGFKQCSEPFILDGIPHIKMSLNCVRVVSASLEHVELLANVVCMALGEELAAKLRGDMEMSLMQRVVSLPNSVYSYENSLVALVDDKPVGAIISYDGAKMEELRKPTFKMIKECSGLEPQLEPETQADEYYIDSVAVLPEYQGKGIGRILVKVAVERAFQKGFDKVGLLVDSSNPKAEQLYLELGFKRVNPTVLLGHEMWHMQIENY